MSYYHADGKEENSLKCPEKVLKIRKQYLKYVAKLYLAGFFFFYVFCYYCVLLLLKSH